MMSSTSGTKLTDEATLCKTIRQAQEHRKQGLIAEKLQENFAPDVAVKLMQAKQCFHDLKLNMKHLKVKLAVLQTLQQPPVQEHENSDEELNKVTEELQNLKDKVEEKQGSIEEKCKAIQTEYDELQAKYTIMEKLLERLKQKEAALSSPETQAMDTD